MKALTISVLVLIQTVSVCLGQTNIERQTKNAKVFRDWKIEKRFSSGNKVILNYEIEVEGEEDECGNWVLSVGIIEWDNETPFTKSGIESIVLGFVSKDGSCEYANLYQPQPGKANIVIDGSIVTSKNYKTGRGVEIEELSDGIYRLTKFSRRTYTGKKILTFNYISLTAAEKQKIKENQIKRTRIEQNKRVVKEKMKMEEKKHAEGEKRNKARSHTFKNKLPVVGYNHTYGLIIKSVLRMEKDRRRIRYPSFYTYSINGELNIIADTLGQILEIKVIPKQYYKDPENDIDKISFSELKKHILDPMVWEGYKVKCEYWAQLYKTYKIVYVKVKYKNGKTKIHDSWSRGGVNYYISHPDGFESRLKDKILDEGTYLVSYYSIAKGGRPYAQDYKFGDFIEIIKKK